MDNKKLWAHVYGPMNYRKDYGPMSKVLVKVYMTKDQSKDLKARSEEKGISVSSYVCAVLFEGDISPAEVSLDRQEKISVEEEVDPRTGFRRCVKFTDKGFILNPKTDAEKEYNRKVLAAGK